jgi:hypothetical protein
MAFGRPSAKDERRELQTREWLQKQNGYAVASMVLGVFSLIEFGVLLIFGIAGIVTGFMALRQLREPTDGRTKGRGLAVGGIVISAISLIIAGVIYAIGLGRA